jgi:hypothetical protein
MATVDPTSKAELQHTFESHLRTVINDDAIRDAVPTIAAEVTDEHLRLAQAGDRPLLSTVPFTGDRGTYVIHDNDLKFVDESTALAVALGLVTSSGWLGVLAKLISFLYRLRRKQARLEGEPALALLSVIDAPRTGWSVGRIRDHLAREYHLDRSEEEVKVLLQGLQDVRLVDGTRTKFADEQQGLWFKVDV